jgi:hypothetical protein
MGAACLVVGLLSDQEGSIPSRASTAPLDRSETIVTQAKVVSETFGEGGGT